MYTDKEELDKFRDEVEKHIVRLQNYVYGSSYGSNKEWRESNQPAKIVHTDLLHDLKHLRETLDYLYELGR